MGMAVWFRPQATEVELPPPLVHVKDLLEAPGPGFTVTEEKSLVE